MSDDESRHGHLPTAGEPNFSENGSETTGNDQTGLPSWTAALTAQMHASFAEQMKEMRAQKKVRDEARQERVRVEGDIDS